MRLHAEHGQRTEFRPPPRRSCCVTSGNRSACLKTKVGEGPRGAEVRVQRSTRPSSRSRRRCAPLWRPNACNPARQEQDGRRYLREPRAVGGLYLQGYALRLRPALRSKQPRPGGISCRLPHSPKDRYWVEPTRERPLAQAPRSTAAERENGPPAAADGWAGGTGERVSLSSELTASTARLLRTAGSGLCSSRGLTGARGNGSPIWGGKANLLA